jgi:hypothetical protein
MSAVCGRLSSERETVPIMHLPNEPTIIERGYTKTKIVGIRTPAARVSKKINFRRAYFQPIMRPVHVDAASARAVAAKNIFTGTELAGGIAGGPCVGFGFSTVARSGLPPSGFEESGGATFRGGR